MQLLNALLHLLCLVQIVPEPVGGALCLQHVQLPLGRLQSQRLAQILQIGQEIVQLYLVFIKLQHGAPLSFP